MIDAYGHVSLPRFWSVDELLAVMDSNGVQRAIVATAPTCPDLRELARAQRRSDRFRVVGLPLGETLADADRSIKAQLDAGFIGIRFAAESLTRWPGLLETTGRNGGTPFVFGGSGFSAVAPMLLRFLGEYPKQLVVGIHFCMGVSSEPPALTSDFAQLLAHERFVVIFSRQGAFDQTVLHSWVRVLQERVPWSRILFGSETPVCLWRDEQYIDTARWVDSMDRPPSAVEKQAFCNDNAERLFFSSEPPPMKSALPPDLCDVNRWRVEAPVWLFPHSTIDVDEPTYRKIMDGYVEIGAEKSGLTFRQYVTRLLIRATANTND